MAVILDRTDILGYTGFLTYTGQSATSFGTTDIGNALLSSVSIPSLKIAEINTTVNITKTFNTYYKMEGYNPSTQRYEVWHSQGTPLMTAPSGNVLTNISIVATWQDR